MPGNERNSVRNRFKNLKQQNMPAWLAPAIYAAGTGISYAIAKGKDKRQIKQQNALNDAAIIRDSKMLDIQNKAALQMWEDTGYAAQKDQMKRAEINPALMYGMGGGGGQTTGTESASVSAPSAPAGSGRETEEMLGMGIQAAAQTALLQAQKKNLDAQTNKLNQDTVTGKVQQEGMEYDNVIKDLITNRDKDGNLITDPANDKDRVGFKDKVASLERNVAETVYKVDENKRQELMNDPAIKKVQEEIALLQKKGVSETQIAENLEKEGKIKDLELSWGEAGLTRESLTKFIQLLILKMGK